MSWLSWLLWGKARTRISEFQHGDMRMKLHRVRIARSEFAYEVDILVRRKHEWVKVGCVRQSDSRLLVDLLRQIEVYVNGLH